jgi:agmatine deiminase
LKSKICIFITLFLFLTLGINVHSTETNNSLKRVPAEWEPQEAIWIQWPGHWEKAYEPTFAKMSEIISRYEKLHILYGTEKIYEDARKAISDIGADPNNNINWHEVPNDNAWMRTMALFTL